jgi:hypothetical protein
MLDIIFVSKMYDWAVDFSWGGSFQTLYNGIYNESHTSTNNFVSQTAKVMKLINKSLDKLVATVSELEY